MNKPLLMGRVIEGKLNTVKLSAYGSYGLCFSFFSLYQRLS
jgi:hypothetical protein